MTQQEAKRTYEACMRARNLFEMLGVHKGSNPDELSAARGVLARQLHPDRWAASTNAVLAAKMAAAMATVNAAHGTLSDKAHRARYLAELATGRTRCAACKGEGFTRRQRGFTAAEIKPCQVCGGSGLVKKEM